MKMNEEVFKAIQEHGCKKAISLFSSNAVHAVLFSEELCAFERMRFIHRDIVDEIIHAALGWLSDFEEPCPHPVDLQRVRLDIDTRLGELVVLHYSYPELRIGSPPKIGEVSPATDTMRLLDFLNHLKTQLRDADTAPLAETPVDDSKHKKVRSEIRENPGQGGEYLKAKFGARIKNYLGVLAGKGDEFGYRCICKMRGPHPGEYYMSEQAMHVWLDSGKDLDVYKEWLFNQRSSDLLPHGYED